MKIYVVSLGAGLLVGVVYGLLNVRSPAPPVVALVGLLGILLGEQIVPIAKRLLADKPVTAAWTRAQCAPHVLGELPCAPHVLGDLPHIPRAASEATPASERKPS